jgi:glutamyl-Q tRNA(Asp) synthetase
LGSYLDARSAGASWLLRLDDIDTARCVPGAEASIRAALLACGLAWDGEPVRQSERSALYAAALARLRERGLLFNCDCSRRSLAEANPGEFPVCRGNCRQRALAPEGTAQRVALDRVEPARSADRAQGNICFDPALHTDVVVRRRDGVFGYALAVVVDDSAQGVTDVVRGADLLPATSWQLGLYGALGLTPPTYLHLPVVVEPGGGKLAKSRRSVAADTARPSAALYRSLELLRQEPPAALSAWSTADALEWAVAHWRPAAFAGLRTVPM